MATIKLEDAMQLAAADEFWAIRGKAIQAYASLEQSVSSLFAALAGTDQQTASIIFFRINSADSRNKIMEKLFQKKYGEQFNLFRNSLFKQIGTLDRARNEIVHWNVVNHVSADADGNAKSLLMLMPPANWFPNLNSPTKSKEDKEDMVAFSRKCDFYTRLVNMFSFLTGPNVSDLPDDVNQKWEAILNEPVVYPSPTNHPLYTDSQSHMGPTIFSIS